MGFFFTLMLGSTLFLMCSGKGVLSYQQEVARNLNLWPPRNLPPIISWLFQQLEPVVPRHLCLIWFFLVQWNPLNSIFWSDSVSASLSTVVFLLLLFLDSWLWVSVGDWSPSCLVSSGCYNKYHRLGGLNNRHLCLTGLESGESRIKMPVDLASGESPLPALLVAVSSLSTYGWEREVISLAF